MKIFILRHEDRTKDCSFFSPLTKQGLENAVNLVPHLKENKVNLIFSSPFIRTLQTIYPYSKEENIKVNLEYGLSEIHADEIIPRRAVGLELPEYLAESFNSNPEYKTIIKPNGIKYPEKYKDVVLRIKRILTAIIGKYYSTNMNIVLVTHQSLCVAVLEIVNKSSREFKNKIDKDILNNYPKGKLCLVFDNDKYWTYKPIN
jgi:2,3-bisphosphoglycerate-dependent phosphoglycerate mutase